MSSCDHAKEMLAKGSAAGIFPRRLGKLLNCFVNLVHLVLRGTIEQRFCKLWKCVLSESPGARFVGELHHLTET